MGPRVLAELRLGLGVHVGKKRVARLMRLDGLTGVSHRRKRRGWKPTPRLEDLVKRQFRAHEPDRLWFCDIRSIALKRRVGLLRRGDRRLQPTDRGLVDLGPDHCRDRRRRVRDGPVATPTQEPGTVVHADEERNTPLGSSDTGCAKLAYLGSMGRVASSVDNALIESFWSTMQRELASTGRAGPQRAVVGDVRVD